MSKKSILFVMDRLSMGGAVRVLIHLVNNISREEYDVHLALFSTDGVFQEHLAEDVTIHDINSGSVKKGLMKFMQTTYKIKPDLVFCGIGHVSLSIAPFLPILKRVLPNTYWVARETAVVSFETKNEKHTNFFNWLYRTFYKNFDLIICQSNYMQSDLVTHFNVSKDQTTIINNPLDVELVVKRSKDPIDYPFPKSTIRLLSVGRLSAQKRYDMLLKTMAKLDKKYTLTLVGDGEKEEELRALVKELGLQERVHFALYQGNPYPYMREADFFVLSSRYEGLPNVILEANACGTPAVVFACPGTDEVMVEGKNGFTAPCMDSDKLAEKIEEASSYPFDSEAINKFISEKYNKALILSTYEERLLKLINEQRG